MKVLVVDDDALIREMLRTWLESEGDQVAEAVCGDEAVQMVHAWHPDIMLLDIMMNPTNGWEVLSALAVAGLTPTLPIIIMSGYLLDIDRTHLEWRARQYGARAWLTKPLDLDEVRVLLDQPPAATEHP